MLAEDQVVRCAGIDGVTAPTLALHRRGERATPFALGRDLASRIAGARFVAAATALQRGLLRP